MLADVFFILSLLGLESPSLGGNKPRTLSSLSLAVPHSQHSTLVNSLSCRVGDLSRSCLYTSAEYLKYSDIELKPKRNEAKLEIVRPRFTLSFCKGHKDTRDDDMEILLYPMNDPLCYHVCPTALLLTHALRHGFVYSVIVEQVLERAARAANALTSIQFRNTYSTPGRLRMFSRSGMGFSGSFRSACHRQVPSPLLRSR